MSVWENYPNLSAADFRTLVAVTAQVLLDSDAGAAECSPDLLQRSTLSNARDLERLLKPVEPTVTREAVQTVLEDEELAIQACRSVLDQVRRHPELAERVAREYDKRKQKMTGVEVVLLAGALVVLATRIKSVRWGGAGGSVDFEPANESVTTFLAGLVKGLGLGQP